MESMICPSLSSDVMSYWAVGADVLLFKLYGFIDFLSTCWISAVTRRSTLSEQGSSDSSSLGGTRLWILTPLPFPIFPKLSAHIQASVYCSCPHFLSKFSSNKNIPNNSPNPSMQDCSITVFRRMGLGTDTARGEGAVGGWWNELSWRVVGGERGGKG